MLVTKNYSSQPRKVRKRMIYRAPLHVKSKQLVAPLSEELREKHGIKRIRVRKGDRVLIVRGAYKGHEGRVVKVSVKKTRIYVEGVNLRKADGTEVPMPIHPSKVVITELNLNDPLRKEIIERKKAYLSEEVVEGGEEE